MAAMKKTLFVIVIIQWFTGCYATRTNAHQDSSNTFTDEPSGAYYTEVINTYWDVDNLAELIDRYSINKNVEELLIIGGTLSDISILSEFTSLKKLELRNLGNLYDISPLSSLVQLEYLHISGLSVGRTYTTLKDIDALLSLTNLKFLNLNCDVQIPTDFYELRNCEKLEHLIIYGNSLMTTKYISQSKNLQKLELHFNELHEIHYLQNLTELQELLLTNCNGQPDLTWIKYLTKLERLYLYGFDITDLSPLAKLPHLELVDFDRYSKIHNLMPLLESTSLKYIVDPFYREDIVNEMENERITELFFENGIIISSKYDL